MESDGAQALTIRHWSLPLPVRLAAWLLTVLAALAWVRAITDHNISRPACHVGAICTSSGGLPVTRLFALAIVGILNLTLVGMLRSRRQAFFITTIVMILALGWTNGLIGGSLAQSVALQAVTVLILVLLAIGARKYVNLSRRHTGGTSGGTVQSSTDIVAGWHPDPSGRYQLRYWDGTRWTEHVSTEGTTGTDPI